MLTRAVWVNSGDVWIRTWEGERGGREEGKGEGGQFRYGRRWGRSTEGQEFERRYVAVGNG